MPAFSSTGAGTPSSRQAEYEMPLRWLYGAADLTNSFSSLSRSTLDSLAAKAALRSRRSCARWRRLRGSADAYSASTAVKRRFIESGVRLRPRRGLWASSASRYRRTARRWSRPSANAALCSRLIGVRLREDWGMGAQHISRRSGFPFRPPMRTTETALTVGGIVPMGPPDADARRLLLRIVSARSERSEWVYR